MAGIFVPALALALNKNGGTASAGTKNGGTASAGTIFVLTLNRASALKVEGNEQNLLLPQNFVANTKGSV